MSLALPFRLPASRYPRIVWVAILLLAAVAVIASFNRKPRSWRVDEAPIVFWAWRNQTPAAADVHEAIEKARARAIFLRAGQIDYQDGKLRRIRPVSGALPTAIDLHLVYNATRSLLAQLETLDEKALANSIAGVFEEDLERAAHEHAQIVGLQIDLDVPTRLLGRYEKMLRALRVCLKPGTQLSITGLPTWMQSSVLQSTLAQVDFWIPQFYGAEIPEHADQLIPISSSNNLESFVSSARALNKPFYAGLAAFSWALLYNASGQLISLRGDLAPALVASDSNLELIDQRPFAASLAEWRYVFRARAGGVIDGLAMQGGDILVLDVPSAESLRQSARIVRQLAGKELLGICVFRLPQRDDPATLTITQTASALSDLDSFPAVEIRIRRSARLSRRWVVEMTNVGTASAIAESARIDLALPSGSIESIAPNSSTAIETLCTATDGPARLSLQPCSERRANLIRFKPRVLVPGQTVFAQLELSRDPPARLSASVEMRSDTGQFFSEQLEVSVESGASHEQRNQKSKAN